MINNRQSGVTLIEVLVTLFVMTIGLLGLAGLQSTSVKEGLDTAKRSQIMWLVTELVERMRANPGGQATGYTTAAAAVDCAATAPKRCANNTTGSAATDCTANEMATYDVWEVFCGHTLTTASDPLNLSSVSISCGGTCTPRSDYTVSISWITQPVDDSRLLTSSAKAAHNTQNITMVVRP